MKPKNVFFFTFMVLIGFFNFVLGCNSFLILHKCSFIPNFVFTILILLKNCKSFGPLKTCICPSIWFRLSADSQSGLPPVQLLTHWHGASLLPLESKGVHFCFSLVALGYGHILLLLLLWNPHHHQSVKFQSTYKIVYIVQTLPYFQFILHIHIPWIILVHCVLPCLSLLFLSSHAHPYCSFQISHVMYTPWILFFLFHAS